MADESVEKLLEELLVKQANVRKQFFTCPNLSSALSHLTLFLSFPLCQWRNEQTILAREKQQGCAASNSQTKLRRCVLPWCSSLCRCLLRCVHCLPVPCCRTSVCRMSSKDKINVQDQSKEKSVSGSLEFPEEPESSSGEQPL